VLSGRFELRSEVIRRIVVIATFVLPPGVLAFLFQVNPDERILEGAVSVCAIVWMLVGLPLAIVSAIDLLRAPIASEERPEVAFVRQTVRLPLAILGVACVGLGSAVFAWQAYEFVRHFTLHPSGAMSLLIPFGLMVIRLAWRPGPERAAE